MRNEWGNYDAESMRVLAKELREQDITVDNCACGFRIFNILENLKIPEAEIKKFLETIYGFSQKMDINADKLKDAFLLIVMMSDKLTFSEIPKFLQELKEEIEQLEKKKKEINEEIQTIEKEKIAAEEKVSGSLKNANTTLVNLDIFVNTKDKLESYGIPVEDINKFARCTQGIRSYSNYDPFKVIERFSDFQTFQNEIESKQKIKNDLEIDIKKLEEIESDCSKRLNLKHIKLKNLDELEKIGFYIEDIKKIKGILSEIYLEHNVNIEQTKVRFFELLEGYETRIALETENNRLLQLDNILENQIKNKRQILHCQELVGPILKKLFDYGIEENDILAIKAWIDIIVYTIGKATTKLDEKREIINDLSGYSNLRLANKKMRQDINNILNTEDLENIQKHLNRINQSSSSINNSENSKDRKYLVLCDSIF